MENKAPQSIEDIIDNVNLYLEEIQKMDNEGKVEKVSELEGLVMRYFQNPDFDKIKLIPIAAYLVDALYRVIISLPVYSVTTSGYFGIVINRIFWELSQKGVNLFYIIDNHLRDDKFMLSIDLFKKAGFDVVTPNSIAPENHPLNFIDTKPEYTRGTSLDYKVTEGQVVDSINKNHHIVYIEKDDSVNYLSNVLKLAEEFQSRYLCVFRNKSLEGPDSAQVFMGSFGDVLDK